MPERRIDIEGFWREPDRSLKLNSVQKHVITFARKHKGVFLTHDYELHLNETVEDVKQRTYLLTRKNNACNSLVKAGYLIEKHRGEYLVNPLVLQEISEQRRKEPFEIKDNHIKLLKKNQNGYLFKSELKKEHAGKSEKEKYRQDKMIDGMFRNLTANDFLECQGKGTYRLTPLATQVLGEKTKQDSEKSTKAKQPIEFEIKPNHIKLMMRHKDGVLTKDNLLKKYVQTNKEELARQEKLIEGMLKNLYKNGYLDKQEAGNYVLTDKATKLLEEGISGGKPKSQSIGGDSSKITKFDGIFLEVINSENVLDWDKINLHPRSDTIIKRIESLKSAGYINQDRLSDDLLQKIGVSVDFSRSRPLTFDVLTKEQQQILNDTRKFLNLYQGQIIKYIYQGNSLKAEGDIKFLLEKGLLKKDKLWDIYVLGDDGIKITNFLTPGSLRYKTKVYSRREEVGHDALVYTTYKHFEEEAARQNLQILEVKTDRQLRSEDAKAYGAMVGSYPDLVVKYLDPITKKEHITGLEVDIQYDERTIENKILGTLLNNRRKNTINTVRWYCSKASQLLKVAKAFERLFSDPKSRNVTKAKYLELFFIDDKGEVHPYRWR